MNNSKVPPQLTGLTYSENVLVLVEDEYEIGYYVHTLREWYVYSRYGGSKKAYRKVDEWWPMPEKGGGIK